MKCLYVVSTNSAHDGQGSTATITSCISSPPCGLLLETIGVIARNYSVDSTIDGSSAASSTGIKSEVCRTGRACIDGGSQASGASRVALGTV
jgi:hypothetical protein